MTWSPASDAQSGLAGYQLTVNGQTATKLLDPTATSTTLSVVDGPVTVRLAAVTRAGTMGAAATVAFLADRTAPSTPASVAVSATDTMSWQPAVDTGSGVAAYVLYLEGVEVRRVAPGAGTTATVVTPAGRHTWSVGAVDAAGNLSAAGKAAPVTRAASATFRTAVPISSWRWREN
jgi:hypothetical protein